MRFGTLSFISATRSVCEIWLKVPGPRRCRIVQREEKVGLPHLFDELQSGLSISQNNSISPLTFYVTKVIKVYNAKPTRRIAERVLESNHPYLHIQHTIFKTTNPWVISQEEPYLKSWHDVEIISSIFQVHHFNQLYLTASPKYNFKCCSFTLKITPSLLLTSMASFMNTHS